MSDDPQFNLSKFDKLFSIVQQRLDTDNIEEVQKATDILATTINNHLEQGDQLAFLRRLPDGTLGLTAVSIEKDDED